MYMNLDLLSDKLGSGACSNLEWRGRRTKRSLDVNQGRNRMADNSHNDGGEYFHALFYVKYVLCEQKQAISVTC